MKPNYFNQKGVSWLGIFIFIFILVVIAVVASYVGVYIKLWDILPGAYAQVGIWLALLGIGVFLIIMSLTIMQFAPSTRLFTISKIGMAMISLSLLVVILNVLMPLLTSKVMSFEECKELVATGEYPENVYKTMACIFVGYSPSAGATTVTYVNFIIVAIICPFAFFYFIFDDLIADMGFPKSDNARHVIAFIGSYVALRGALASYFVEFFTYGWTGMGALAFGVFMIMMAWSIIKKFYSGVITHQQMKDLLEIITGKKFADPKTVLSIIAESQAPFDVLFSHGSELINFFKLSGYEVTAANLQRIYDSAKEGKKDRNKYVREEIKKLLK